MHLTPINAPCKAMRNKTDSSLIMLASTQLFKMGFLSKQIIHVMIKK